MSRKYFGTDGIRGRVGEYPITPDFVVRLGWAVGRVLAKQSEGQDLVLIGKDTRISGYMFESALEAGLINAGVDVGLLGPMPTPAIAYLTQAFRAQAGIVISASHNPYTDNGIKLFDAGGNKLADAVEQQIEAELDKTMLSAVNLGKARRIDDAKGRYIEFCKSTISRDLKLNNLKIALDCAHGATYQVAPNVFQELGAEVIVIHSQPDGLNINEQCGSTSPQLLQRKVLEQKADIGIAFDGDGDRVLFVDHQGELVDGDELLYIISLAHHQNGKCNGVVGTLMSNFGLELAYKRLGIPFQRAGVGDRYVLGMMHKKGWHLGGESSGHIICGNVTTTGDGIISALQVVSALHVLSATLAEAKAGMNKVPQKMINVRTAKRVSLEGNEAINAAVAEIEHALGGKGRVLLRPSGTEPVVRVMVEGEDGYQVEQLVQQLATKVELALESEVS